MCWFLSWRNTPCPEINNLLDWFNANSLAANPSKFQAMLLSNVYTSTSKAELGLVINGTQVNSSDSITILGVIVDNKLNFNDHIYTLRAKAGKQLNALQRLSESLDKDSKLAIYKSFIMSKFNFCPVVWMFTLKSSLNKLEEIHNKALRFVLCECDSCYENLLTAAYVPGIRIYLLRCLPIEVFECVNGLNPFYLNKMIHKNRVHMNYAKHPFCPDLKLIIFIMVSKLSVAMGPKSGIHCPFHWNQDYLFMNSNKL